MLYRTIHCTYQHQYSGSYYTIPIRCIRTCKKFPCEEFSDSELHEIYNSEMFTPTIVGFKKRSIPLTYLFKYKDGTVKEAYQGFDKNNPEWSKMEGVEEVFPVRQVLVPQMKLVPKPKEQVAAAPNNKRGRAKKK